MDLLRSDDEAVLAPAVASERGYLRGGLPALYQDGDFAMRFVGALETVLDPLVATIDALPQHFSTEFAPQHIMALLAAWLGVGLDEAQSEEQRREVIRNAVELARRRGTKAGLELVLGLTFRDVPLRVEDGGRVSSGVQTPATDAADDSFVVYCDADVSEERLTSIAALVNFFKPVNSTYRLMVKRPPDAQEEKA